jgi:hypothetical protein
MLVDLNRTGDSIDTSLQFNIKLDKNYEKGKEGGFVD